MAHARGAALLISQHLDVALAAAADGVHLPEISRSIAEARTQLGNDRLVGASRHDRHGLIEAERDGADYATLSPVFASPGKGTPLGIEGFANASTDVHLPVFALGGVQTAHVRPLLRAGAHGVAVIREVLAAPDPAHALSALLSALRDARSR